MDRELFQARPFKLSGAGAAAQGLSNAGGLDALSGLGDAIASVIQKNKTEKMLDKHLFEMGFDDHAATAIGATTQQAEWAPGKMVTVRPSAMTVRQLMERKKLGAEPSLRDVLAPGAQLADDVSAYADAPVSVAEKLGPFIRGKATPGGSRGEHWDALSPERKAAVLLALDEGRLTPMQLSQRGNKLSVLADQFLKNPKYSATGSDATFAGATAEGRAAGQVRGGPGTRVAAAAGTLGDVMTRIEQLLPAISPVSFNAANAAYRSGLTSINDKQGAELLTLLNEAAYEQALMLKGGNASPTQDDIKKARENFSKGLNAEGFAGVKKASDLASKSRVERLTGKVTATINDGYSYQDGTGADGKPVRLRWKVGMNAWEPVK